MLELVTCLGGGEPSFTALHAHPQNLDGIIYMSRHLNDRKAVVVFDRAAPGWGALLALAEEKEKFSIDWIEAGYFSQLWPQARPSAEAPRIVPGTKGILPGATVSEFLRADPDIIMVGESRDHETVSMGVEASLTGHLVFSTLHTNSAPESIVRLLDMGMDPFNFADALLGILAQRLAKKLCDCKQEYVPDQDEINQAVHRRVRRLHAVSSLAP